MGFCTLIGSAGDFASNMFFPSGDSENREALFVYFDIVPCTRVGGASKLARLGST